MDAGTGLAEIYNGYFVATYQMSSNQSIGYNGITWPVYDFGSDPTVFIYHIPGPLNDGFPWRIGSSLGSRISSIFLRGDAACPEHTSFLMYYDGNNKTFLTLESGTWAFVCDEGQCYIYNEPYVNAPNSQRISWEVLV